jgi:hypothetical protein
MAGITYSMKREPARNIEFISSTSLFPKIHSYLEGLRQILQQFAFNFMATNILIKDNGNDNTARFADYEDNIPKKGNSTLIGTCT